LKIIKREVVYSGKFLRVVNDYFQSDKGTGVWETVERLNVNNGAVVVVALTKDNEIILERNWRVPLQSYVIQLPAGLTDKTGETIENTARRELLEETGYLANELIPLIDTPESAVLTPTSVVHYLAKNVEYIGNEKRDTAEEIEVIKIPLSELDDFLLNLPQDTLLDLRVTGLLWVLEKKKLI
jgi:ADP-ribose pyrophosphatase